jgi:spore coat polysaccharide biosynthesis protein SpsF (cytidylyltransferase family)
MEKIKTLCIIQARMNSTRLPGKILMRVRDKTILEYVLIRVRQAQNIDKIVIATTDRKEDDATENLCKEINADCYRGSENDVLDRFYQAAKKYEADTIIRITGDCPLLPPEIIGQLLDKFNEGNFDMVSSGPSFAEGFDCEIFSFKMLELAARSASKISEREHVTLYLHTHPEVCKKCVVENKTDDSKYRVVVDEPRDFEVVKTIIENLYSRDPYFTADDVKKFLDMHPEVAQINSDIVRNEGLIKSLAAEKEIQNKKTDEN